jgi:hypothetical protein
MRLFMTHEQVAAEVPTRAPKQHREHKTAERFGAALVWVFLFFATPLLQECLNNVLSKREEHVLQRI